VSKNSKERYVAIAYRFGDHSSHSYVIGVFKKKHAAIKACEHTENHRGYKYLCEVHEMTIDEDYTDCRKEAKVVREYSKKIKQEYYG